VEGLNVEHWIQGGALALVVTMVIAFLKFLRGALSTLRDISDRCHAVQDRSTTAMMDNTRALARTEKVVDQLHTYLVRRNGD
jgi:hypothetical protein